MGVGRIDQACLWNNRDGQECLQEYKGLVKSVCGTEGIDQECLWNRIDWSRVSARAFWIDQECWQSRQDWSRVPVGVFRIG